MRPDTLTFPCNGDAVDWSMALKTTLNQLSVPVDEYLNKLATFQGPTHVNAVRHAIADNRVSEAKFREAMRLLGCKLGMHITLPIQPQEGGTSE